MKEDRCAGLDWAAEEHVVRVVEADGATVWEASVEHSEAGIAELCRRLRSLGVGRVTIERPDGVLVDRLAEAGICVLAIHPNQVKAARARFRAAGGKSDRFDAFVLAELARTDAHRFRALRPDSDATRALRALVRAREDLVRSRVRLANELRAQLEAFWPGAARIFADVDSKIALAFIERYPTPADARGLGEKRLAGFLARNRYPGRREPAELLRRLRQAPAGRAGETEAEARRAIVLGLVAALEPIVGQITELSSQIRGAVRAHPDGEVFCSLFRDPKSVVTAAMLIAELGDDRGRYPDAGALAADAGMCPVASESGKRRHASFRWACDKRLRDAFGTLVDASRQHNPWARERYACARAAGKDHPHATRIVGRAWTRVVWRMWRDRAPYDPTRHGALNRLAEVGG